MSGVIFAPAIPAGADTQVQFNDGGVFGGDSGLAYNKTTDTLTAGSVVFAPAANTTGLSNTANSLTGSNAQSLVSLAQTWNTTGTPTLLNINVTNTASNAASKFIDLQVGGTSRVAISLAGQILVPNGSLSNPSYGFSSNTDCGFHIRSTNQVDTVVDANLITEVTLIGLTINGTRSLNWSSNVTTDAPDVFLLRDAANTLAQRNGVNSQTQRLYKSFTDASNYTRAAWLFDANGVVISGESAGTGDANIDITLTPKGTGRLRYGTHQAVAAEVITGYIEIKDASGTTRKLAVIS